MRALVAAVAAPLAFAAALGVASAETGRCADGAHAVAGRLPAAFAGRSAHVALVPDTPLARTYVLGLRDAIDARRAPETALDLVARRADYGAAAASVLGAMRLTDVDARGSFRCGGLDDGRYLTVGFVAGASGAIDPRTMILLVSAATVAGTDRRIATWTVFGDRSS